jgi:acetyltransferase-like isoleucine patch superfamily enzyme
MMSKRALVQQIGLPRTPFAGPVRHASRLWLAYGARDPTSTLRFPPLGVSWALQCGEGVGIIEWAHRRESPLQRRIFAGLKAASKFSIPPIPGVHRALLAERRFRKGPLRLLASKLYYEPLLRLQCTECGPGLLLHEDMPKIIGNLSVHLGARVVLSGAQVWIAGGSGPVKTLYVGDDCSLGHETEIVVGDRVQIGRHVRIANHVLLNGYDGHPLDPLARARNEPPGAERAGTIVISDYAWIGDGATILKGVTVGRGAVVASRAVVTADIPELAVVAGNPARIIRSLPSPDGWVPESSSVPGSAAPLADGSAK